MTEKNKAAVALGKLAAKARAEKMTPEQISERSREYARRKWDNMTPEQRKAERANRKQKAD